MKRLWIACVLLLGVCVAHAQKVYFIYIQSDSNTPFFVKLDDKISSATPPGYVIIPKLVDSVYQLTIGKTGDAASESRFSVTINKQDKGFLLREADGKFSLFDLQAMTSLRPLASAATSTQILSKRTDAFSVLLAQAANDPSLLEVRAAVATTQGDTKAPEPAVAIVTKEPAITNEPEQGGQQAPEKTDTVATTPTDVAVTTPEKSETHPDEKKADVKTDDVAQQSTEPQPQEAAPEEAKPYKPSVVTRKSESSTSEGFGLVFLDKSDEATDTIRILIPNQNITYKKDTAEDADSKKFLNMTTADPDKSTVAEANEKLHAAETTKKPKACAAEASEKDFFKLRKNMAAEQSEEAMIAEAKKFFKRACFSTAQIKNLSSLFLTANGKYNFFDAAYGHVSNREQYATLQTELDDAYYVNRFKALIANQ